MAKNENSNKRSLIPVQVKWEEVGTTVEGKLLSKEITIYQDNTRGRYLIETDEGLKVVMGCYQLDQALALVDVGCKIGIAFLGQEGTSKANKMNMFDIWVDDDEDDADEDGVFHKKAEASKSDPSG